MPNGKFYLFNLEVNQKGEIQNTIQTTYTRRTVPMTLENFQVVTFSFNLIPHNPPSHDINCCLSHDLTTHAQWWRPIVNMINAQRLQCVSDWKGSGSEVTQPHSVSERSRLGSPTSHLDWITAFKKLLLFDTNRT